MHENLLENADRLEGLIHAFRKSLTKSVALNTPNLGQGEAFSILQEAGNLLAGVSEARGAYEARKRNP